jgi:hypothetical protein
LAGPVENEFLALSRNLIDLKQGWLSRCVRFRYT